MAQRFLVLLMLCSSVLIRAQSLNFTVHGDTTFNINLGGLLDGNNCQKAHMYYAAGWPDFKRLPAIEPMDSIILFNNSGVDIPFVQIISHNNIYNIDSIAQSAKPSNPSSAQDSVVSLYRYMANHNFYFYTPEYESREFKEVTKHFGVYGYGHCGSIANSTTLIADRIFGQGQRFWLVDNENHGISEITTNGKSYYLDADEEMMVKGYNNHDYLSMGEMYEDLYLYYRTKTGGSAISYNYGESCSAGSLRYENNPAHFFVPFYAASPATCYQNDTCGNAGPELFFSLKSGERMKLESKSIDNPAFHHYPYDDCSANVYGYLPDSNSVLPVIQNIQTQYNLFETDQPDSLKFYEYQNVNFSYANHEVSNNGNANAFFISERLSSFPLVKGRIKMNALFNDSLSNLQVFISFNEINWMSLQTLNITTPTLDANLDSLIMPTQSLSKYKIFVKVVFNSINSMNIILNDFRWNFDFQISNYLYPSLFLGDNPVQVKTTSGDLQSHFYWKEHNENTPPIPPSFPTYPMDASWINDTEIPFEWEPLLVDQEGDSILEWQFQLSETPNFQTVLANNFDYYSLTQEGPHPHFLNYFDTTGTRNTFFNNGRVYYWHVRVRDNRNAWSNWSNTWSFGVIAPKAIHNLHFELENTSDTVLRLVWQKDITDSLTTHYHIINTNSLQSVYFHTSNVNNYYSGIESYVFPVDTNNRAFRVFALDSLDNCSPPSPPIALPSFIYLNAGDSVNFSNMMQELQHPFPNYPSLNRSYFLYYDSNFFNTLSPTCVQAFNSGHSILNICYMNSNDTIYKKQFLITVIGPTVTPLNTESNEFHIWPNPAHKLLFMNDNTSNKVLMTMYGEVLRSTKTNTINLDGLEKGIYFIRCEKWVEKVVVE